MGRCIITAVNGFSFLLGICLFLSCNSGGDRISSFELPSVSGGMIRIHDGLHPATVIAFMAPDCPLCVNYSLTLNTISKEFTGEQLRIVLLFPGEYHEISEIREFIADHELPFEAVTDKNYELSRFLDARVTPEAVLLDLNGEIRYKGAIDDWAYGLGLRRQTVNEHYLKDAITAVLAGEDPKTEYIKAFGCHIEL